MPAYIADDPYIDPRAPKPNAKAHVEQFASMKAQFRVMLTQTRSVRVILRALWEAIESHAEGLTQADSQYTAERCNMFNDAQTLRDRIEDIET
jgi:predicted ABC-class ATPase